LKDLEEKFSEVEKRVKALVSENKDLRKRVAALERELAAVRREAQEHAGFSGKKMHVREKIERVLQALEAVGGKK
jgi:septal ring factor EnvC (AmiA/AmiB activator)